MSDDSARRRVRVSGRVQGVGYRESCRREAERLGLTGTVRNLGDGSVEAVFEGPAEVVEQMVRWCREGPRMARVQHVDVRPETPVGERGFTISF